MAYLPLIERGVKDLSTKLGAYVPAASRAVEGAANQVDAALGYVPSSLREGVAETGRQFADNTKKGLEIWKSSAQELAKVPVRVAASLADLPRTVAGKEPLQPFDVPGIGEVKTSAREAVDKADEMGAVPAAINAGSHAILDVASLGAVFQSIAAARPAAAKAPAPEIAPEGQHMYHGIIDQGSEKDVIKKAFDSGPELGKGYYVANTPESAKVFGDSQVDVFLPKDLKTYKVADELWNDPMYKEALRVQKTPTPDLMSYLHSKYGYDAIDAPLDVGGRQTVVAPEAFSREMSKYAAGFLGVPGIANMDEILGKGKEMLGKALGISYYDRDEYRKEHPELLAQDKLLAAIGENETSVVAPEKRYAYSKPSGSKAMGRDLGRYQVTEGELKSFGKQLIGSVPTSKEFLASPELQEKYMRAKIAFLQKEGLTPEEILAVHAQGMTGWGDKKVLKQKIADANKHRSDYVSRGMSLVNTASE